MCRRKKVEKKYEINIVINRTITVVLCNSFKEKETWLFDYFTIGEEKWWAWKEYETYGNPNMPFEEWVAKILIRKNAGCRIQAFQIRPHKNIIIREKNN